MMDPIIYSFSIGNLTFSLYWYGFLVMLGVGVAAWVTALAEKSKVKTLTWYGIVYCGYSQLVWWGPGYGRYSMSHWVAISILLRSQ